MSAIRVLSISAVALLALTSCVRNGESSIPRHCGIGYTSGRDTETGSPIPACALPGRAQVADACASASLSPYDITKGYISPPGYEARNLRCRYARGDRSKAQCIFELRQMADRDGKDADRPITQWRPAQGDFTFYFVMSGDESGHAFSSTVWGADARCSPSGPKGELP